MSQSSPDPDIRFERTSPILRIFDEQKAKEFYLGYLGFALDWEHRFAENLPLYAQVSRSGLILHLSEHHGDATPGSAAFVLVNDVHAYQRELAGKDYKYLRPGVQDLPWGKVMTVIDPFGNSIRFCEQKPVEPIPVASEPEPRPAMPVTPRHIGIVACSAEGAALCYRTICVEGGQLLGGHAHPEVSMHTPSLAAYEACLDRGDWEGVGALMLASAGKLAGIGADFLICPDNTIHQALPLIAAQLPRPWLHIAEVVATAAAARGFRRLGLLGTRWLVESEVYPDKLAAHGLAYERPTAAEREELNRIIMDELVRGIFRPEAVAFHQQVIARMQAAGCDAVVLGCTEIPLIMGDHNSPLPTLDSTRLLARAALRQAVQGTAAPAGAEA
jgi:aspartate racemase